MKAIVYESNTGFTMKYAKLLEEKTGLPTYLLENSYDDLEKGTEIFFMGWVCAGKIEGYKKAAKKYNIIGAAAVGASAPEEKIVPQLKKSNNVKAPLFYLQGGVNPAKLTKIKRAILCKVADTVERTGESDQNTLNMIEALRYGGDFTNEKNLNEILEWMKNV
ncbi:MAG: hypothetical protein Q4Q53_02905 [Methanocorpusculum sp.]|nr:hypothetical protein [Methanocorpusculum sp.]